LPSFQNNASAKLQFQRINEANEVLSDPEKRKKYDQYGKDWEHADEFAKARRAQSSRQGERGSRTSQNAGDFSDFFESMFGGGARSGWQMKYRGEDFNATLELPLLAALTPQKQTLNVNGKSIRITIPAGIEHGQTIKIARHGGAGLNGGPNGDLFITFSIGDHPDFKRLGNDLYTTVELDLYKAVLGGELLVHTLDGKVKLKRQRLSRVQKGRKLWRFIPDLCHQDPDGPQRKAEGIVYRTIQSITEAPCKKPT
jgi:curved DNA-binding protein